MARVSPVSPGTTIESTTFGNAIINDYVSQTDTDNQNMASNLNFAAGKGVNGQIIKVGSDTILATTKSLSVTHGLGIAPTIVLCQPTADFGGRRWWISNKALATFTITISSADVNNLTFDWIAVYQP